MTTMTEDRKKELQSQISNSNKILNNYFHQIVSKRGNNGFVTKLNNKKLNRQAFLNEIVNEHKKSPSSDLCLYQITISNSDVRSIVLIKESEWEIVSSIHKAFFKIINRKLRSKRADVTLSFEDLENEALFCAVRSVCSYEDSSICFSTYICTCVERHLDGLLNRTNCMSKISRKAVCLKAQYAQLSKLENSNFENTVVRMSISNKDISLLKSALCCSSVSYLDKDNFDKISCDNHDNFEEVSKCIGNVDLSELEKAVLQGFMESKSSLGINSKAKNIINPKTGKPYSRMAVSYAWRRVKEKIKNYRGAA
jgi:hypothetical protein